MPKLLLMTDEGEILAIYPVELEDMVYSPALADLLEKIRGELVKLDGGLDPSPANLKSRTACFATPAGIRTLRAVRGLTQKALGNVLQVSTNTIARWERGERRARADARVRLMTWIRDGGRS